MKSQAKESKQIAKAREKLQKTLNREGKKFTKEALNLIADKIRASIERNHSATLNKRKITIKKDLTHQQKKHPPLKLDANNSQELEALPSQ